jgi:circadian clock protein KaiA
LIDLSSDGLKTDHSQPPSTIPTILPPQLTIGICTNSESLSDQLGQYLRSDRYNLTYPSSPTGIVKFIEQSKHQLDCLVIEDDQVLQPMVNQLYEQGTLLPVVILQNQQDTPKNLESTSSKSTNETYTVQASYLYHPAEIVILQTQVEQIAYYIDQALAEFLKLSPHYRLSEQFTNAESQAEPINNPDFLTQQRHRLAEKLKERLGYLAVYYKRNPQHFFRHLSSDDKQEFRKNLRADYRQILLNYFSPDQNLNQKIDDFVHLAFFADLSVAQIVEIHMELIEEFAKQLKLEGRSEDFLLDYRLTLIDIIAHLCEMYRRSIPREV